METAFAKVEELAGTIKDYVNTRIESVKLSAAEKSSGVIANLLAGIFVAMLFLFFIFFVSIALAFVLGEWIGQTWAGFLIVAFLYLFAGLLIWVGKAGFIRLPIMNAILKQLFNQEDEED
jgi:Fe2+ transport system protein B